MIEKKIHYCWFGRGEKPKLAIKCIESWKHFCPDYELIEWNEDNIDVLMNPYTKMCYEQKKYAFLTDYLRLIIVEREGGIYFDTDVEVVKSFDDLLDCGAFFGFENNDYVNTGEGFGAEAHHSIIKKMINEYDELLDGKHGTVGCPILNTQALLDIGLERNGQMQIIDDIRIFPKDFFNPRSSSTGKMMKTKNTYSIHWYSASWMPWKKRIKAKIGRPIRRVLHYMRGER